MATNTLTGEQLLDGFSEFLEDSWSGTTTAAGNSTGTTLEDSALAEFGEDALADGYVRLTSGSATLEVKKVKANTDAGVVTFDSAFSAQVASGVTYEWHQWDPNMKYRILDRARIVGLRQGISQVVMDETITTDGFNWEFDLPTDVRQGPVHVYYEDPIDPDAAWNVLKTPRLDSLTGWSESAGTAALYADTDKDLLVPKYDTNCTKLTIPVTTAVSYSQVVADMSVAASDPAGRRMTFGMWVYSRVASRITLKIADDSTNTESSAHGGAGWQFLTVTHEVLGTNATTLTVSVEVTSGAAMVAFLNRAWFMYGAAIPNQYRRTVDLFEIRRDGSVQRLHLLGEDLPPKRNLRLVGRGPLSAISASATATMELDAVAAELLYAIAAKLMLQSLGLRGDGFKQLTQKIQMAEAAARELRGEVEHMQPQEPRFRGPHF
jgi:hypothetical protein